MAVRGVIKRDGLYYGTKTAEQARNILAVRESKVVESLKRKIFNFPPELVMKSLKEGRSIRYIVDRDNIDYTQYIGELRDYQTVGTAFMYLSPRSMIGDGVGLGKTAEISALINILREKKEMNRFLIAVETSALGQTQAELMKFTGLNVITLPSEAPKLRKAIKEIDWKYVDGIVIKHSTLKSSVLSQWIALNVENDKCRIFDTFFLDESSLIKNNKTKVYEYVENICKLCNRVHLMNATTFETCIMDIYYQIDMMDSQVLPCKSNIEKEFCKYKPKFYWRKNEVGKAERKRTFDRAGYKNQEVFKNSLKLCYFGRCKKDIGMDMPHIYKVYEVEPTNDQSVALSKGYRYNEVLNCPENIPELNLENNRKNNPKLDRLCELVENDFAGQQIMVYCFHVNAQEALKRELEASGRKCVILNGQDKSKDKDINRVKTIADFNSGKYDVIITNIKKSLNLNAGDVCIFYEYSSTPASMEQIRGRIDRNTDDRIKTFVLLLYKGTDEYNLFVDTVKQRAKDGRDLTIDAETCIDYFINSMEEDKKGE